MEKKIKFEYSLVFVGNLIVVPPQDLIYHTLLLL